MYLFMPPLIMVYDLICFKYLRICFLSTFAAPFGVYFLYLLYFLSTLKYK